MRKERNTEGKRCLESGEILSSSWELRILMMETLIASLPRESREVKRRKRGRKSKRGQRGQRRERGRRRRKRRRRRRKRRRKSKGEERKERMAARERLNKDITQKEVEKAINQLKNDRAAGINRIIGEIMKEGGEILTQAVGKMCCEAWRLEQVPRDWMQGVIFPLYKEGDNRDPLNYRGITLLSIVGKVYNRVLTERRLYGLRSGKEV